MAIGAVRWTTGWLAILEGVRDKADIWLCRVPWLDLRPLHLFDDFSEVTGWISLSSDAGDTPRRFQAAGPRLAAQGSAKPTDSPLLGVKIATSRLDKGADAPPKKVTQTVLAH
jgi:hypothetical protein